MLAFWGLQTLFILGTGTSHSMKNKKIKYCEKMKTLFLPVAKSLSVWSYILMEVKTTIPKGNPLFNLQW